jgi:hypothetical protein
VISRPFQKALSLAPNVLRSDTLSAGRPHGQLLQKTGVARQLEPLDPVRLPLVTAPDGVDRDLRTPYRCTRGEGGE